ncbi:hypothetical protein M0804_015159 [Polistes exclamans]|nr:hypothetical protein M0804_015385 [Polistes exclamans]KAI4473453.1 hypothetical protein M0804_015344 [Polistes exclamans]KAI4473673.1 hypothetical protein M0804_015237 [Polistes exclamans]KAI4473805.1 hypothetical protein M0804_015159 [Polistes exclamans]
MTTRPIANNVVVVHFFPSRTSRPVGCRSTVREVDCRVASAHAADPRSPGRLPGGRTYKVSCRNYRTASGPSQARPVSYGVTDLVPYPWLASCWQAESFDGQYTMIPVCDATALGTLRTRLETRTKESNMCASHWDSKT